MPVTKGDVVARVWKCTHGTQQVRFSDYLLGGLKFRPSYIHGRLPVETWTEVNREHLRHTLKDSDVASQTKTIVKIRGNSSRAVSTRISSIKATRAGGSGKGGSVTTKKRMLFDGHVVDITKQTNEIIGTAVPSTTGWRRFVSRAYVPQRQLPQPAPSLLPVAGAPLVSAGVEASSPACDLSGAHEL